MPAIFRKQTNSQLVPSSNGNLREDMVSVSLEVVGLCQSSRYMTYQLICGKSSLRLQWPYMRWEVIHLWTLSLLLESSLWDIVTTFLQKVDIFNGARPSHQIIFEVFCVALTNIPNFLIFSFPVRPTFLHFGPALRWALHGDMGSISLVSHTGCSSACY